MPGCRLFPFGEQGAIAQVTREDYQRAEQFLTGNLRHKLHVADVEPHWIAKTNRFWYRKASPKGVEFFLVDSSQGITKLAFDQARLATALSKETRREYKPTELPFDAFEFPVDGKSVHFQIENAAWSCNLETYNCKEARETSAGGFENESPSKEWVA